MHLDAKNCPCPPYTCKYFHPLLQLRHMPYAEPSVPGSSISQSRIALLLSVRPHHMLIALQRACLTRPGLVAMCQIAISVVSSSARRRVVDLAIYVYLVTLPLCCCMAIAAPAPPNACRVSAMLFTGSTTYIRYDLEGKGMYIGWSDRSACLASAFALAFRVAIYFEQECHGALCAFGGRHV